MFETTSRWELTERECLHLLGIAPIGRIVFTEQALPAILPVRFVLREGGIILRTTADSRLARAVRDAVVAFEVDHFTDAHCAGWSVVALGRVRALRDPLPANVLAVLERCAGPAAARPHYLRIGIELLSGHRRDA
ncbi:pyridoxamine 5'-phosphate oxidase family protein [Crossiella cryophila]|uniref:Nitroimidazol reductase NimA-like FMN-containing flavoprotein (Pyridoxamine 5'-phosphate oxidase superfamily) n=1 Tax=Crossiella cryophila TaxID=43355 RepID=A0A7W7CFP5_9PSEU|nr:pyridoxamine 5'-phosphate oxidase family protein [Crossiella cryophila]MBB4680250.1 nitroimidazol reductase NimA-like FMN-containing flavoprotein (pyridoxamine 5'-phosphate oxidase superfamily) [Crossiella cryophila]